MIASLKDLSIDTDDFYAELVRLYNKLETSPSWSCNNPESEAAFGEMRALCSQTLPTDVTERRLRPHLLNFWIHARSVREESIAENVINAGSADTARTILEEHSYFYRTCGAREISACLPLLDHFPSRIAFIGSGPMPLTSLRYLDFARRYGHPETTVLNVELEAERIETARRLLARVDRANDPGMLFLHADGRKEIPELAECDVVAIASFVGLSEQDKIDIMAQVATQMRKGAVLLMRGSTGLLRLLWAPVDVEQVESQIPHLRPRSCISYSGGGSNLYTFQRV